jgi:hypothetical protein
MTRIADLDKRMRSAVNLVARTGVDLHTATTIEVHILCQLLDIAANAVGEQARLADAWRSGAQTALEFAIRNEDGVTLRLDKPNPFEEDEQ